MTSMLDDHDQPALVDLPAQLASLQGKFASLAAIEQAKGALMVTYGLTADAAFNLLRFHSQTRNVKLRAIAAQLTALLSTSPTSSEAITHFDQLIDTVTRGLQANPAGPATEPPPTDPPPTMSSLWSQIAADQHPHPSSPRTAA